MCSKICVVCKRASPLCNWDIYYLYGYGGDCEVEYFQTQARECGLFDDGIFLVLYIAQEENALHANSICDSSTRGEKLVVS